MYAVGSLRMSVMYPVAYSYVLRCSMKLDAIRSSYYVSVARLVDNVCSDDLRRYDENNDVSLAAR